MRCTKCGGENRGGRKFCAQCGAPISTSCTRCGASNEPGEKFCGECGATLVDTAAANAPKASITEPAASGILVTQEQSDSSLVVDGERKTVTALFADIKGSTALEEDLDPEEARAIIDPALKLMIDAVHRYDGYVVQSTGDGIFALFGAPIADEDHPQRALYAALRIQEELRRYGERLQGEGRAPLLIRIGINTGEVVVRSIATGGGNVEYTPIGHTANLAARMQTLAHPGATAITEATRKLVEGYFTLKALGPARIKGISEPVEVYEVTGLGPLRTRLQRSAGRGLTKFVGREREIEAMTHAAELAKQGRGQIVAAMAEPGVGKSRLFHEFKARNQSGWMLLETFSVSHAKAPAYLPVVDLLRDYFEITPEDDHGKRREKVSGRVMTLDRALETTLPYLFALIGVTDESNTLAGMEPQLKRRRTLEAVKNLLLRESREQPMMLIFEDLHWIDGESQALLNMLAEAIANTRILLLVNYRPEYHHEWGSKTYYTQLRLDPLGKDSAEEMLSALLDTSFPLPDQEHSGEREDARHARVFAAADGSRSAPAKHGDDDLSGLKRLIVEKTDGNPFFMEEIVQSMFEESALVRDGAVRLAKPLAELRIPPTVRGILASRIDRRVPREKELLQTLAVIGKEIPLALIEQVAATDGEDLQRMLASLQLAEFIHELPTFPDAAYVFKHALTQEVAYGSVLAERRKALHLRIGEAIEATFANHLDDYVEELARHYSRGSDANKAAPYFYLAGQKVAARSAYADAIAHFTSGLELLPAIAAGPQRDQLELGLQLNLGQSLMFAKGYSSPDVEGAFSRARELCAGFGDTPQLYPVLYGLWGYYLVRAEYRDSQEIGRQLLSLAERQRDPDLLLEAHAVSGQNAFYGGCDLARARSHFEKVLSIYDPRSHQGHALAYGQDPGIVAGSVLPWILWFQGYPEQALSRQRDCFMLASGLSHKFSLAYAKTYGAALCQLLRDIPLGKQLADEGLALSTEHGFAFLLLATRFSLGWALNQLGQSEEAVAVLRGAKDACRALGAPVTGPHQQGLLADALAKSGHPEQGLEAISEGLAEVASTREEYYEAELYRLKGALLLALTRPQEASAEAAFMKSLEVARRQSAKSWELRTAMSLYRLKRKQCNPQSARKTLESVYGWFTEGFDTPDLKDAKALLTESATM